MNGIEFLVDVFGAYDRLSDPKVECSACGAEQPMWSTQTTDGGPRICAPACWLGANLSAKRRSGP